MFMGGSVFLFIYICGFFFFYSVRYCDQLKISESTHVLQPFLPSVVDGLIHLAAQFTSEVLNLVMETLCIVCSVDPVFTANAESKICPFTIAIFLKYSNGKSCVYCGKTILLVCKNIRKSATALKHPA